MIALYRFLLGAYPRWFRERYQAELVAVFTAERNSPRYAGALGPVRFWLHILSDVLVSAFRLRLRAGRRPAAAPRLLERLSSPTKDVLVRTALRPGGSRRSVVTAHQRRSAMETLLQDLRHACRLLARRPGFTAVAVLSLALGIGGNAMIFGLVDGFVLNPFPFPDPDRVVGIGVTFPRVSDEETFVEALSAAEFLDIAESRTIQRIAAFDLGNRNISGGDRPERVFTGLALTDPFGPFGLRPALGRGFTAMELAPNGPPVAIISYRLWQSRFGADPAIIGRAVRVNGTPTTVVGVMPAELLILGADLWIPWDYPLTLPRNARQIALIGRLAPDATLQQANAELATIADRVARAHRAEFGEYEGWRLSATPWAAAIMRDARPAAFLLLGAVALVLLMGRRLTIGPPDRPSAPMEIVGVVANTRNRGVQVPAAPEIFVPMHQQGANNQLFLLVRTDGDAAAMLPAVRRQIAAVDPDQPIYAIRTMEDAFSAAAFQQGLSMILLGLFAALGLLLSGIGIYGVMSYAVSARTKEIGVRMAVGAARRDVVWLVLGQVLRLTAVGLTIGVGLVVAAGGALRRLLFEVRPFDPLTVIAVVGVLGSVALLAAWLPAWRASRVDPVDTLRYE